MNGTPSSERISVRVAGAVAETLEMEPADLSPPLYRIIDPDALDTLFESHPPLVVEFEYAGCSVAVRSDRTIEVNGTVFPPLEASDELEE